MKQIIFCCTCNRIVGDKFPIWNHNHDFGNGAGAIKMLEDGNAAFSVFKDTKKNRKWLAKNRPPRDKLEVRL